MTLFMIQEVAEPQTTSTTSFLADIHAFQKCSSALTKSDLGVSIHGISSMNSTFLFDLDRATRSRSIRNASIQPFGIAHPAIPQSSSESRNAESCFAMSPFSSPVCWNANLSLKNSLTRYVFPIRRRPYMATNSDSSDVIALCRADTSRFLPTIDLLLLKTSLIYHISALGTSMQERISCAATCRDVAPVSAPARKQPLRSPTQIIAV